MITGYFRLSPAHPDRDALRQAHADELRAARCLKIVIDEDGRTTQLAAMLDSLAPSDFVVVPSIGASAPTLSGFLEIAAEIRARNCTLRVIAEELDTTRPGVWHTLTTLAEFERSRRAAPGSFDPAPPSAGGLRRPGRPAKLTGAQISQLHGLVEDGRSFASLAREWGVHSTTIMRAVRKSGGPV